ncbi:MAG: DUF1641 domain-containing protein [Proteobacteria bacterium]|jgi:uncharacterized protein YjgD (DUF1641 family)|nr:DUF1641 domain-containing protein [Pseudomonadota bacterium]
MPEEGNDQALLRNTRNLTAMLERLEQFDDFLKDATPLLGEATNATIMELNQLEQEGVFKTLGAMRKMSTKFSSRFPPDRLEKMGDGFLDLAEVMEKATSPAVVELVEAATSSMADTGAAPDNIGVFGLGKAVMGDADVRRGMAVLIDVARAIGKARRPGERLLETKG